jgi:ADP-ribose pyrophosphatase YjhB (NUDIX family)
LTIVQLCSGLLRRGETVLLTRCLYPGEPEALWTLPGGRQEEQESKLETIVREFWEEASLRVRVGALAYVSESIDAGRGLHVMNATFLIDEGDPRAAPRSQDANVVDVRFVPVSEAPALLRADVLRTPVEAALRGHLRQRYFSFREEDVVIPFFRGDANAVPGSRARARPQEGGTA